MTPLRTLVLTVDPVLIVAGCYAVSRPGSTSSLDQRLHETRLEAAARQSQLLRETQHLELADRCERLAEVVRSRAGDGFAVSLRPPYLLVSDLPEGRVLELHDRVLVPTAKALWRLYFDTTPREPITIVFCRDEETFREQARRWDGYASATYAGYYQRDERRIVLNVEMGHGALAHELVHALAHADCEDLPEWFDEGLASLHEETIAGSDGLTLTGVPNWRFWQLPEAVRRDKAVPLRELCESVSIRGRSENLNYATLRTFCLYLQERGLLAAYYRKLRTAIAHDPSGTDTLCALLERENLDAIDRDFRTWVLTQPSSSRRSPLAAEQSPPAPVGPPTVTGAE